MERRGYYEQKLFLSLEEAKETIVPWLKETFNLEHVVDLRIHYEDEVVVEIKGLIKGEEE